MTGHRLSYIFAAVVVAALGIATGHVAPANSAGFSALSHTKAAVGKTSILRQVHYRRDHRRSHRHRHFRKYGRHHHSHVVRAPFTRVETGRRVIVDAPFAHVYVGRGVHVRAPFVDLWVPRHHRYRGW